ncbi:NAD(P)/FAD-dependent oxidoreductase [Candidatus Gracilibacteria bacterium]|nr:NAD(P)/FAD-dependent oxidoreductase [Candidatus Gracilibacteria bacterium]
MKYKKRVVILGAGFAGIQTAITLEKLLDKKTAEIVIINKRLEHIYRPDLYEIATAYNKDITDECKIELKESVAIPLKKIVHSRNVRLIQDTVIAIHEKKKKVVLENGGDLHFDYLVVTLGSVINYFNISGLEERAHTLKTVTDAIKISCDLDHLFYQFWSTKKAKDISLIIGGGGATGVELACELVGYMDKLCEKYAYRRERVTIKLIEGSPALVGGDIDMTKAILQRFKKLNIICLRETFITKLDEKKVYLKDSQGIESTSPCDFFIWTGGVKPHPLIQESFSGQLSPRGGVMVNEFLQMTNYPEIFAGGDNAHIVDEKSAKPVPWLAQLAVGQGHLIGENIAALITEKPMKHYKFHIKGIVIPLGHKYALFKHNKTILIGMSMWLLRRLIDLKYAMSVLPKWYAFQKWWKATTLFSRND